MKSFTFVYQQQGTLPAPQPLRVYLTDEATGAETSQSAVVDLHSSVAWLSVTPATGNTVVTANVQLTNAAKNLAIGNYTGQVEVVSAAAEVLNSPQIASVSLDVLAAAQITPATLTASPAAVATGEQLTVTWSGIAQPMPMDWIALYTPGAPYAEHIDWFYVSCTKTEGMARASGSCSWMVAGNLAPGVYELRLFANNIDTLLATSNEITVQDVPVEPPPAQELSLILLPTFMQFFYQKPGKLPRSQTLRVSAPSSAKTMPPITVELYSSVDWLNVTPAQGTTVLAVDISLNNAAKKLTVGVYNAEIEVRSSAEDVVNSPQFLTVSLEVVR